MSDEVTVTRNDAERQYEITVDGHVAGRLLFREVAPGRVVLPHTVIDPAYGGRGLGSTLARGALTDLAERGDTIVPRCPFVAGWLRGHEVPGLKIDWPDDEEEQ